MDSGHHTVRLSALGLVCVTVLGLTACADDSGGKPRTVTVAGSGRVTGTPDTLHADVGVQTTAGDVSSALNDNNAKVKQVTDAVMHAGMERKDIATQQVDLSPQYSRPLPGGTQQVGGYQATNTVRLTIRALGKASAILGAASGAAGDATRISNVGFAIDDDSKLLERARTSAFHDARSRAQQYASLSGASLGKVQTINEQTSGQQQPTPLQRQSDVAASDVPVEPGQQTMTLTVTVTYALS